MELKEKLGRVYEALRDEGRVVTKKDFANLLGMNFTTIVDAMNGGRALSPTIVAKACALLNGRELPKREAPAQPRTEDTGKMDQLLAVMLNQSETIRLQVETFKRALDMIDDARAGALGAKRGENSRTSDFLQENGQYPTRAENKPK